MRDKNLTIYSTQQNKIILKSLSNENLDTFITPLFSRSGKLFAYLTRSTGYTVNILEIEKGNLEKIPSETGASDLLITQDDQLFVVYSNGNTSTVLTKPLEAGEYEICTLKNTERSLSLREQNNHVYALSRPEGETLTYTEIHNDHIIRSVELNKESRIVDYVVGRNNDSIILRHQKAKYRFFRSQAIRITTTITKPPVK